MFPEFGPGDRLRLLRRKVLHIGQSELARSIGVTTQALSAWEAGRNEAGITPAVALRVEMLTGQPGTAAFLLGVLPPTGPKVGPLPRLDSNQKPPGLRHTPRALVAA
jgi:DNA-binding XRE family transcriptional regulator